MPKSKQKKDHKKRALRRKKNIDLFLRQHRNLIQKQIAEHQKKLETENNIEETLKKKYDNEEE